MKKSEIFKAAHKIAKTNNSNLSYRMKFSQALKVAYVDAKYPTPDVIAKNVRAIDAAISTFVEGAMIIGTYRGKKSEGYKYCTTSRSFIYNNAGRWVSEPFSKAIA